MNKTFRFASLLGAVALAAAACGEAPGEGDDAAATDGETAATADFQTCMVSDSGGINDKSFNESAYNGLQAAFDNGVTLEPKFVESQAETDYAPNVQSMVDQDCGLIVTVGFLLAQATQEAAEANPEEKFAIVDFLYTDPDTFEPVVIENVKPLVFNTQEAAFLAGYLAAGMTQTGKVGTWGGLKIPTVTIFMDGFADGVAHYNQEKGANVEVLGWDKATQEGQFVGDFESTGPARQISDNLIQQGADILLPVAGPIGESAAVAAQEAGNVNIIWVDADGFETLPDYGSLIITSVLKGIAVAVETAANETAEDSFTSDPFIGTLENDGVGLAPYHDFEETIPQELKDEVEQLKEQIISGELTVESDAAFS
ncbi:MAG TPA: BMP family ABC transporter substrate-binding protein [Jiangellaceae bacterium]